MNYNPVMHNEGVQAFIAQFQTDYPDLTFVGCPDTKSCITTRNEDYFHTMAHIDFQLNPAQTAANTLVDTSRQNETVEYNLVWNTWNLNPKIMTIDTMLGFKVPVYNDMASAADAWGGSGYLAVQKYV